MKHPSFDPQDSNSCLNYIRSSLDFMLDDDHWNHPIQTNGLTGSASSETRQLEDFYTILPFINMEIIDEKEREKLILELKEMLRGYTLLDDYSKAILELPMSVLLVLEKKFSTFSYCCELLMDDDAGEGWWIPIYDLVEFSKFLRIIPNDQDLWEFVGNNDEGNLTEMDILWVANVFNYSIEPLLEEWCKQHSSSLAEGTTIVDEFQYNFDADCESMIKYFGFDLDQYFSMLELV